MKDPVFYYFGIYRVDIWAHRYEIMLKSKADGGSDDCLVMTDGRAWNGKQVFMGSCIEATAIGDGRELWYYHTNLQLQAAFGWGRCLETRGGQDYDNNPVSVYYFRLFLNFSFIFFLIFFYYLIFFYFFFGS